MGDEACVQFLQWALPRLGYRWPGFRRVRGTVCRRLRRRCAALDLASYQAYRAHLEAAPDEWAHLDTLLRIPISRFYRDHAVFDRLRSDILPLLAAGSKDVLPVWSAGCASGEEVYTLTILWQLDLAPAHPGVHLSVMATDTEEGMLARARTACYRASSLREVPDAWRHAAFERRDSQSCVRAAYRRDVAFRRQDIRREAPRGPFALILCRNLVFTYFDAATQARLLDRLVARLWPNGFLVVGAHETLPEGFPLTRISPGLPIFARDGRPAGGQSGLT